MSQTVQFRPFSEWICLCLERLLLEANIFPQSGQLFVFLVLLGLRPGLRLSEKSERAGEAGAEDSTEAEGDKAGEEALEAERLRSTGWD